MADLASAWFAGSQQAIDWAWRRHTAEMQRRMDERQQRQDDFAYNMAQRGLAEMDRINAETAAKRAEFERQQAMPSLPQIAPQFSVGAIPRTPESGVAAVPQEAPSVQRQRAPFNTPIDVGLPEPTTYQQQLINVAMQPELARGARGPEVQELQQRLVAGGHMTPAEVATGPGVFGPRTQAALMRAQRALGLPPTGVYDAATQHAMTYTPTAPQVDVQELPEVTVTASRLGEDIMRRPTPRTIEVPAEAASITEAPETTTIPEEVPAPASITPEAVAASLQRMTDMLNEQMRKTEGERVWRMQIYAQQAAALAETHPTIGYAIRYGGVVFDIPSYNQAYKENLDRLQRQMVWNGEMSRVEAIANANNWTTTFDSNGNIRFSAMDDEQQVTHEFGMSRAQAEKLEALFEIAENNGGFLPEDEVRENIAILAAFPSIFQTRRDAKNNPTRELQVSDRGVLLSQDFHALVNARLHAITGRNASAQATRLEIMRSDAERRRVESLRRYRQTFEQRLARRVDTMTPEDAARMAAEYTRETGEEMTPEEVARLADSLVFDPRERAEMQDEYARKLAEFRQGLRDDSARTLTLLRASLRPLASQRTGRRVTGSAARATAQGMAAVETVDEVARMVYNAVQQARNSGDRALTTLRNNPLYSKIARDHAGIASIESYVRAINSGATARRRAAIAENLIDVLERADLLSTTKDNKTTGEIPPPPAGFTVIQ